MIGARDRSTERAAQVRAVPAEHAHLPPPLHPLLHHTHRLLLRQPGSSCTTLVPIQRTCHENLAIL